MTYFPVALNFVRKLHSILPLSIFSSGPWTAVWELIVKALSEVLGESSKVFGLRAREGREGERKQQTSFLKASPHYSQFK